MPYRKTRGVKSSAMTIARGLGWFSIGLGLAEMLAPKTIAEQLGMNGKKSVLRFYGAREIAAGIGILMSDKPAPWVWGRVAGDALDLATLGASLSEPNPRKANAAIAFAAVLGVTALDTACAQALNGTGRRREPARDYSDRCGMPKPPNEMRGAARDFKIPRDMRAPEAMRSFTSQGRSERLVAGHSRA